MSGIDHPNMEHHAQQQAADYNYFILRQNFTSGILRDEAAMLNALITGYSQPPDYVTDTETQREYKHPSTKRIDHMKSFEETRLGRYAYSPNQQPPNGILPTFNAKVYPEVIPRFHLPKMPH